MRLELGEIQISDVKLGDCSKVENGVLYVNTEELRSLLLEDEDIASVDFEVVHPGESVRVMPVKDVIEPRVKVEGPGGVFPGMISKVTTVGSGVPMCCGAVPLLPPVRLWASRRVSST